MKITLFITSFLTILFLCFHSYSFATTSPKQTPHPITVKMNGLVCSFCAQGIKKKLLALPGVQAVKVNLNQKTARIDLEPETTLTDSKIEEAVRDAGYTVVEIQR